MNNNNYYNNNSNQFNPQYFQQQFDNAMGQYKNYYNQLNNVNNNGFIGQYVNSYEEVEKSQVNMNGIPTMFVANGVFWIKKFVNGQSYINAYKFEPINNLGEPSINKQEENKNGLESDFNGNLEILNAINSIENKIDNFNKRLTKIENNKEIKEK